MSKVLLNGFATTRGTRPNRVPGNCWVPRELPVRSVPVAPGAGAIPTTAASIVPPDAHSTAAAHSATVHPTAAAHPATVHPAHAALCHAGAHSSAILLSR